MYSSGYSQVSKYSQQAQKKMQYRSESKSCGYYMRIVFFFSSLIQSLIIVSLVLFLVYGKKQDSASTTRIQDLEESFSRLSIENVALKQQRKNLTNLLNITLTAKTHLEWDVSKLLYYTNVSKMVIEDLNKKMLQSPRSPPFVPCPMPTGRIFPNCGPQIGELNAKYQLVLSNFTQTTQRMAAEMEQIIKDRDANNLDAIHQRRDKSMLEKQLQYQQLKCKDDFIQSLSGVSNVSKAFLKKIESISSANLPFLLTCDRQRDHLEQIRTNCTSLSREVEDKFQRYLNSVGEQVSNIQAENSRLKAENWRLSGDYVSCSKNRSDLIKEHRQNFEKLQLKHDKEKEKLLMDKIVLNGKIDVLEKKVNHNNRENEHLTEQIKQLNMSCMYKSGGGQHIQPGSFPNFASSGSSGLGLSRTGLGYGSIGQSGTALNKPGSTGLGSSSYGSTGSSPNLSSGGSAINKPGSTGLGPTTYGSTRSSPNLSSGGSALNKPGSTGSASSSYGSTGSSSSLNKPATSVKNTPSFASSGSGLNKPGSTGQGSSSYGSTGSSPNLSSGGIGSSKPTSSVKSSPGLSSTGSASKSGSSGFSWFSGLGSSNTGQSKPGSPGSGTGRGTSSGTGSLFSPGRTSGSGSGTVNVNQHLQDLQRLINPPGPEEKQDLSRMLG